MEQGERCGREAQVEGNEPHATALDSSKPFSRKRPSSYARRQARRPLSYPLSPPHRLEPPSYTSCKPWRCRHTTPDAGIEGPFLFAKIWLDTNAFSAAVYLLRLYSSSIRHCKISKHLGRSYSSGCKHARAHLRPGKRLASEPKCGVDAAGFSDAFSGLLRDPGLGREGK